MNDEINQASLWTRIKRLFNWDVIVRKSRPHPERDKLIYGHERNSLRDRFNRVRSAPGYVSTRSKEELDAYDSGSDYRLRFNLANMVDTGWVPIRDEETKKEL